MNPNSARGFSLIELAIVVLVMGLLLTFAIPSFHSLSQSYQLRGASENITAQFRLAREKAIGTSVTQRLVFRSPDRYYALENLRPVGSWTLPRGISYHWVTGTDSTYSVSRDGRMDRSGMIILQDARGFRDTISIQLSGLVLTQQ